MICYLNIKTFFQDLIDNISNIEEGNRMNYVLAIDGGGTKTEALIGDDKGNILGMYRGGSSNHQIVGSTYVKQTISKDSKWPMLKT